MNRVPRSTALVLLTAALALPALAQEGPDARRPVRNRVLRCLSILDLTEEQRVEIRGIVEAARPALEADVEALRSARQALQAALGQVPPDACAVGVEALAVRTALETLRQERETLRSQIVATLTPEQQARIQGCIDALLPFAPDAEGGPGVLE